jgi:Fur family peroxide stress response transcriptional regulator
METEGRLSALLGKLKAHGYRLTPQRLAIFKILVASDNHPSVEQIHAQLTADFPTMALATVYKTITLLKEEGELLELGFAGESSRYDGAKPYPHAHLICVSCHKIIDPDIPTFGEVPQELAQKYGYQIVNQRVDYFGICPDCQSRAAAG